MYNNTDKNQLHPIGVMPERIWKEIRCTELGKAITRRVHFGLDILQEWVDEYNRLHKELTQSNQA